MAGFGPAIHDFSEPIVQVVPVGVLVEDQSHFPRAPPMLHISLSLPCRAHVIVVFSKYQPPQAVFLREALDQADAMFPGPSSEVVCYADIQRAIRSIGHDIYPSGHLKPRSDGATATSGGWPAQGRP